MKKVDNNSGKFKYHFASLIAMLLIGVSNVNAQCAMCKAQIESSEDTIANGINDGILMLMIIPYILLSIFLLIFFNGRLRKSLLKFVNS